MLSTLVAFAVALAASLLATPLVRRLALSIGFLAVPSGRGVHREPTPLLGGVAVFVAFVAGIAAGAEALGTIHAGSSRLWGVLGGASLVFGMGLLDDRYNLGWFSKLLVQLVAAVLLLAGGNVGPLPLFGPVALLLSLLWIVGLANAMNFLDNMDGVAAGIAAVSSLSFVALGLLSGRPEVAVLAAALAGATIGFLRSNFPPAKIFLGDAGSLLLGYLLASTGLAVTSPRDTPVALLVPVLALGYPIFDITFVSVTRALRGQSLTQGGKDHTSHRLARVTGSARRTSFAIYTICAALGLLANLLHVLSFTPATLVATVFAASSFLWLALSLCRRAPVPESSASASAAVS